MSNMPENHVHCSRCEELRGELDQSKTELEDALSKLTRVQRLYERGAGYIEELHKEVRLLNCQVSRLQEEAELIEQQDGHKQETPLLNSQLSFLEKEAAVQQDGQKSPSAAVIMMIAVETQTNWKEARCHTDRVLTPTRPEVVDLLSSPGSDRHIQKNSAWATGTDTVEEGEIVPAEPLSIADSLREAAEQAQQQSGFVYDESTGLYYSKDTGYYYDGEKGLYYEPYSGIYYFFNTETNSYEFHSRADLSSLSEETSKRYFKCVTGEKPKKARNTDSKEEAAANNALLESLREQFMSAQKGAKKKRKKEDRKEKKRKREKSKESKRKKHKEKSQDVEMDSDGSLNGEPLTDKIVDYVMISDHEDEVSSQSSSRHHRERSTDKVKRSKKSHKSKHKHSRHSKKKKKKSHSRDDVDNMEDGEISSSSSLEDRHRPSSWRDHFEKPSSSSSSSDVSSDSSSEESRREQSARNYPPCIRAIVTQSDALDEGSLYVVTYMGATAGREEELRHAIHVPDEQVSKMHCEISYNQSDQRYEVTDKASQNGTFVNTHRLSEPKVPSAPFPLAHNDTLTLGGSTLRLHIHAGLETCDDCEPGIVRGKIQDKRKEEGPPSDSRPNRDKLRKMQLAQLKKKYGLANSAYIDDDAAINNPAYQDKAASRRQTVGSDNPYQKDEAPSSVNRSISTKNKGHKLLAKMGWKEGDSLGRSQQGITEPIQVNIRANKSGGLGLHSAYAQSLDNIASVKTSEKWLKAQERYNRIQGDPGQAKGQTEVTTPKRITFEQGGVQNSELPSEDSVKKVETKISSAMGTISWNAAAKPKSDSKKVVATSDKVSAVFGQDSSDVEEDES